MVEVTIRSVNEDYGCNDLRILTPRIYLLFSCFFVLPFLVTRLFSRRT